MSRVTHKIFSQDVEVGRIEQSFNQTYRVITYDKTSLQVRLLATRLCSYCGNGMYFIEVSDFADCLLSIPTEYAVVHLSEVDAYLNPKAKEVYTKPLTATSQDNAVDEVALLNAIKADLKTAPTDKLNELYLLLDAELKYRHRKEKILNEAGVSRWVVISNSGDN